MAIRKIIYLPDPRLRKVAVPVEQFDDDLQVLIDDMFETMYDAQGIGLAAPQIGISLRLFVLDLSDDKSQPRVFINPKIIEQEGKKSYQEGCLSVPGVYETVERAQKIKLKALARTGEQIVLEAEDLLADCLQHELDHLNGKVFIDLLSPLKRNIARKKLDKFKRLEAKQQNSRN